MMIVVGHKNPDTDTIVAAIVWADFLNMIAKKAKAFRAGKLNFETKYVLSRFKEKSPALIKSLAGKEVFLVDHGELKQSPEGIKKAKISGVLDHHRIADISTVEAIYYRCEPIGSTSSLIAKIFNETGRKINKKQASLLLSGIISDTLKFASPTTTELDKKIGKELAKISGVDVNLLANKMFEAKSSLKGMGLAEILGKDYKEFKFGGKKIGVGVYETVSPAAFDPMKGKVFEGLVKMKAERKIDFIYFAVIDILKQEGSVYLAGDKEKELAIKVFKGKMQNNIMHVPGLVSRKKQIIPVLAEILGK